MAGGSEGHGHLDTGIGSIPMVPSYLLARWIARWQEGVKAMVTWIQVLVGFLCFPPFSWLAG